MLSRGRDGREPGPLTDIAQTYDRAARTPYRVVPVDLGAVARDLRRAARHLGAVGALSGRGQEKLATVTLLLALASLVAEIGAWQHLRGRPHQASAARTTAHALPQLARRITDRRPPAGSARPSAPALPDRPTLRHPASVRPDPRMPRRRTT